MIIAVNTFATKETTTKLRAPVMLISSWIAMEILAEVPITITQNNDLTFYFRQGLLHNLPVKDNAQGQTL